MKALKLTAIIVAVVFVAGCSPEPAKTPTDTTAENLAVNDEKCAATNMAKLSVSERQNLSSECLRRGTYKKSSGQTW